MRVSERFLGRKKDLLAGQSVDLARLRLWHLASVERKELTRRILFLAEAPKTFHVVSVPALRWTWNKRGREDITAWEVFRDRAVEQNLEKLNTSVDTSRVQWERIEHTAAWPRRDQSEQVKKRLLKYWASQEYFNLSKARSLVGGSCTRRRKCQLSALSRWPSRGFSTAAVSVTYWVRTEAAERESRLQQPKLARLGRKNEEPSGVMTQSLSWAIWQ